MSSTGRLEEEGEEMQPLIAPLLKVPVGTPGSAQPCLTNHPLDQQPHLYVDTASCGLTRSVPQGRVEGETPEILRSPNSAPGGPPVVTSQTLKGLSSGKDLAGDNWV